MCNTRAVFPAYRQDGTQLDDDFEYLSPVIIEVEQVACDDQVTGAGDGQKFGRAFDDAEQNP